MVACTGRRANPWLGINVFVSRHMAVISPVCVAVGVLFPDRFACLAPYVGLLFAFMTFQNSLSISVRDLLGVVRRPVPLICSLAVLLIALPLVAFGAGSLLFSADRDVVVGMVLQCCVPMGISGLMWVDVFGGNRPFALAAVVLSTVLAPFTMPLTMRVLMGESVQVDVLGMMGDLALMVALPAVLGIACNDASRGRAAVRVAPWLAPAAKIMLVAVLLSNASRISDSVRHLTPGLLVIALTMALLSALGYALGYTVARLLRKDVADCLTLGVTCGARNLTAGAVIAAAHFAPATMFPVIIGTLFQHVIAGLFGWAVHRLDARCRERATPRAACGPAAEGGGAPRRRRLHGRA